ncbi:MAG: hypothetical protein PVF05_12050 [Gemmatimonadales bacterium]|jgi:hypothetical protein
MADDRKDEERNTPSWQLPQERQPDSDAYHIWTPRPLLRSIYWKPVPAPPFEIVSASYEIFVDQRAWLTMHEHVWQTAAEKTPFGYLVGDLCEDPNANRRFVNITAALPARFDFREEQAEQISREATLALQLEVERRRGVLAGWYHRHLGGEVQMTEQDIRTHHQHFDEPWQCAFVFVGGGDRSEGGCFRSTPDSFAGDVRLPFYEMASNESLLARGVKRSYLDWTNYTTVDEIRSEPPPRPRIEIPTAAPEPESEGTEPRSDAVPEPSDGPEVADDAGAAGDVEVESSGASTESEDLEPEETSPEAREPQEPAAEVEIDLREDEEEVAAEEEVVAEEVEAEEAEEEAEEEDTAETDAGETAPEATSAGAERDSDADDRSIDVDALIDRVRPARIELDVSEATDEDAGAGETPEPTPSDAEPDHVAALEEAVRELDAHEKVVRPTPRKKHRAGSRTKKERSPAGMSGQKRAIAAAIAGLLIVAAVAATLLTLSAGDDAGAAPNDLAGGEVADGAAGRGADGGGPVAADSVTGVPVTAAQMDSVGRYMLSTISRFYGRAVAHDDGTASCEDLAAAYVDLENAWIRYNSQFKARFEGPMPDSIAARDERVYAGVQDADREYERSGCPRP